MAVKQLFRVVVRQRVSWTPGVDLTVPESNKPMEVEGNSIVRDITDYVENYRLNANRGTLAMDALLEMINPQGLLTPTHPESPFNRYTLNGVDTYAPLLVEGNEVQIYRIKGDQDPNVQANWIPRFRGKIRMVEHGTQGGQDTLKVTLTSALGELTKRSFSGTFSPVMYTTSMCPPNSFFTLTRLQEAVAMFRDVYFPSHIPVAYTSKAHYYGESSVLQPAEISAELLSKLLWWDRDDVYYRNGKYLATPYFKGNTSTVTVDMGWFKFTSHPVLANEPAESIENSKVAVPVNEDTATSIWNLNGNSWYVQSGTVVKDAANPLDDPTGSLKLTDATLRYEMTNLPTNVPGRVLFGYRITDGSSIRVQVQRQQYKRLTYTYTGTSDTILDFTITGPTTFDATKLGGTLINPPTGTTYQWYRAEREFGAIPPGTFVGNNDQNLMLYRVLITTTGTVWMDSPRLEFLAVTKGTNDTVMTVENNILDIPVKERWLSEDGIIYRSPFPQHRTMSRRNNRVLLRTWAMPYGAGTISGFGPSYLHNRSLPEDGMYERELIEGQDYEVLYDKGAIQLAATFRRCEIFVTGTYYDIAVSGHMEASHLIRRLLIEGGIPPSKINLEPTGIIMSKITLSVESTTSLIKALQEILAQLPQNYHLFEDGDSNIIGRYIQQHGSPRIYNPVVQVPVSQIQDGVLEPGAEYWYGITALMADGKETLLSNMASTVPYQDYYDFTHSSIVTSTSIPALQIRPVPNMVGLVVRRAKAYKTAADSVVMPAPKPAYVFPFDHNTALLSEDLSAAGKDLGGTALGGTAMVFTDSSASFTAYPVKESTYGSKTVSDGQYNTEG